MAWMMTSHAIDPDAEDHGATWDALLADGWEPFSVVQHPDDHYGFVHVIYLKKQR